MPVLGTLAPDASLPYTRLPDSLKNVSREGVWYLGTNSAGITIRFRSDAKSVGLKWKSRYKYDMNHMTATGVRGLDLYVLQDDSTWTNFAPARPNPESNISEVTVMNNLEPKMREYMLYLSLYDGVDSVAVGTDSAAVVLPPAVDLPKKGKPVIMYGTSILQGGCATRPGMAHTNILQRKLNHEVVNLGFSGNGRLDYDIAHLIADNEASVIVLDALPNVTTPEMDEKLPEFISIIREKQPTTPILLVETLIFPHARFDKTVLDYLTEQNEHLRAHYKYLVDEGDENIFYFTTDKVFNNLEATVDNIHLTDTGFQYFADNLAPVIQLLIQLNK